ncbi:XRE family transcriptional regulator [Actinomadura syzygii]|uniref:XRE family transcriptional regulator n=1 Tax=Actinomadura syzygii TaxID=1427538 RepID=A0A5D0TS87_9ACTN|nr:XRE family transcriptional regulator [Actinomadura syzygii]TYC08634.1 XRE family transcriptional regulator [Actinomadura syzygii]
MKVDRRRRAELARAAQIIRQRGQRADWPVPRIATQIRRELPEVLPLEAWRWAYGWSRAQTVRQVALYYRDRDLGTPRLNTSMLCRYEHGDIVPGPDYADAFCGVYRARPPDLGLESSYPPWAVRGGRAEYGAAWEMVTTARDGHFMANGNSGALQALRDSISLALETEGPGGGPDTHAALLTAVDYYSRHYSAVPPGELALEVHQVRHMVNGMLGDGALRGNERSELRRSAGWLSALVGNLAFHLGDEVAAALHLATARRLGEATGDRWLECWSLGARAMLAYDDDQHEDAAALGWRAHELADTRLRKAQMLAWTVLRPTAATGDRDETARVAGLAQDEMAATDGDLPGRFGFDTAELRLHLAEASLLISDTGQARTHAQASIDHIPHGRPGWAAASLVLARAEAARGLGGDAAARATTVLDTLPGGRLRANSRDRLAALIDDLDRVETASVRSLREQVATLPPLVPVARPSVEPNGA